MADRLNYLFPYICDSSKKVWYAYYETTYQQPSFDIETFLKKWKSKQHAQVLCCFFIETPNTAKQLLLYI